VAWRRALIGTLLRIGSGAWCDFRDMLHLNLKLGIQSRFIEEIWWADLLAGGVSNIYLLAVS
jgi:hypothetical protein